MLNITGAAAIRNQGADNQKVRLTRLHRSSDRTGGLTGERHPPTARPCRLAVRKSRHNLLGGLLSLADLQK